MSLAKELLDIINVEYNVEEKKAPTALTALGQGLVNALHKEIEDAKKGKGLGGFGAAKKPPTAITALDQPLVAAMHTELRKILKKKKLIK